MSAEIGNYGFIWDGQVRYGKFYDGKNQEYYEVQIYEPDYISDELTNRDMEFIPLIYLNWTRSPILIPKTVEKTTIYVSHIQNFINKKVGYFRGIQMSSAYTGRNIMEG